jgi:hypothetical protein
MRQSRARLKWLGVYREFEASGISIRDFCAERGLNYSTFRDWQRRFSKESREAGFVEMALPVSSCAYTLILRNGRELRLSASFSPPRLRQLIEVLESC